MASVLAAAVLLAACGGRGGSSSNGGGKSGASAPGVTASQITIGSSYPLSGPVAANGSAALGGAQAYFGAINAQGGVKMGDGKTRKIKFVYYDDGYDPAKTAQNYQKLVNQNHVFALFQTFGTAPNIAIEKNANSDGVPQVFVHAGDALFSNNQKAHPWTIGWQPTYEAEGEAYGRYLTGLGKPLTVAVLRQADTLGTAYLSGFRQGIKGSKVRIVKTTTYTPADTSVDSQISQLAATHADVLYMAVAVVPLMISGLQHVKTLGWDPTELLISLSSSINQVLTPAKLTHSDKVFTASFVKQADDPQWQGDTDVQQYLSRMKQYSPKANPSITNAQWGYGAAQSLVQALQAMKTVSRRALMDAIHGLNQSLGFFLPGVTLNGGSYTHTPVHGIDVQHLQGGKWQIVYRSRS
jgi:ABC-type branched-subunit amino acid transport system substrate-binding protein